MNENTSDNSISGQDKNQISPANPYARDEPEPGSPTVSKLYITLSVTALFIALAVAGFGLWVWMKTYQDIAVVEHSMQSLSKRVEELNLKPELTEIMDRLETDKTILSNRVAEQNEIIESLRQSVSKLFATSAQTPRQWALAQSFHLAEIANYNIKLHKDIDTAAIALQAAYHTIEGSADPSLLHVRKVISTDLDKLRNFKQPNLNVIEGKLDQMLKEHKYMPLVKPNTSKGDQILFLETDHSLAEDQDSKNIFQTLLQEINKHLIVKHHDKPIEALPSQQSQIYYYQILHLKLESIRIAVLNKDNEEYQRQLVSTLDWIDSHYTPSSIKEIKEELKNLIAINIAPPLPAITDSVEALKTVLDSATLHVKERATE